MNILVRGLPVHYVDIGEGHPMVILHGLPADHRLGTHHLEPIYTTHDGFRRIYLDLPGMGLTPGPEWITSQDDVLDVVVATIDALLPGRRFSVVGISYGGYLALGVVHRMGDRLDGMMLWAPSLEQGSSDRTAPPHRVLHREAGIASIVAQDEQLWLDVAVVQTSETLEAFRAAVKPAMALADMDFLMRLRQRGAFSFDPLAFSESVQAPSLIITGRQDSVVGYATAEGIHHAFPRSTLAILDRAGHALAEEQPTVFRALVDDWLDRVSAEIDRSTAEGQPLAP